MKVKAVVLAAVALRQAAANTNNNQNTAAQQAANANPFNFFGQPQQAAAPGTDPFSQMMAHGHAMMTGQAMPGAQPAAANPFDPFKMMTDAASQAHQHMTNMHAAMTGMVDQGNQAAAQMMNQGAQAMADGHAQFAAMMTTTPVPAQTGPIAQACPTKIECFSDTMPMLSCSGVQGGSHCVNGVMFPFPQSGVCTCNDENTVCSYKPHPTAFSFAQCTASDQAYRGSTVALNNETFLGTMGPGPATVTAPATAAPTAQVNPSSCTGRCGSSYDSSAPCQCNDQCADPQYNNCCADRGLCALTTTVATAAVVIGGTEPPNPLGTTVAANAYDWVPGFAPDQTSDSSSSSRLYDANISVPTRGPSSKLMMAYTVCLLTYAVLSLAAVRGFFFVRRRLRGERQIDSMDVDMLDEELAVDGPVE